jgi:hypothetical protein
MDDTKTIKSTVIKGTCELTVEGYIKSLTGLLDNAREFDASEFKTKADLNKCSATIRTDINAIRKSAGEFNKAVNDECKIRREGFDGTPAERVKKQEDRIKKMQDAFNKAKKKLADDKAAL